MRSFLNKFRQHDRKRSSPHGNEASESVVSGNPVSATASAHRQPQQPAKLSQSRPPKGDSSPRSPQKKENTASEPWDIGQFNVPVQEGRSRFHDFDLPVELMRGIADLGFKYCTPIQAEILGAAIHGKDAIGKAQTGTGKTAAFLISIIKQLLHIAPPSPRYLGESRALILAHTRELAMQIYKDAQNLCKYTTLNSTLIVGGVDYERQRKKLQREYIDILVATPGRLLDYLERGELHLDLTETLVIDEADRMLDMGFIPQIRRLVLSTPRPGDRQTLMFSATFNDPVLNLCQQWTWKPLQVEIEPESLATETVDQKIWLASTAQKYRILTNLIRKKKLSRVIVFANRRDQTRRLTEKLRKDNIQAEMLSGEISQDKRTKTLEKFRSGQVPVLVATDVAGRGIHVDGVSHVINYTLPEDPEDYVHRIGRTGRAGNSGTSISFACEDDSFLLFDLEKALNRPVTCTPPPQELL